MLRLERASLSPSASLHPFHKRDPATIVGVASSMPENRYSQGAITGALKAVWKGQIEHPDLLDRLHSRTGVRFRHLSFPLRRYSEFRSWRETNDAWLEMAEELGAAALDQALQQAGLMRSDLDALFVVSVTGIASPSLDARLINRLQLRSDIKRTPIFGVGCVGGALGLTRATDYVRAYPEQTAAILAVELCSLTFQRDDLSKANMIATGLFADGAVAVIVAGSENGAGMSDVPLRGAKQAVVVDSRSVFYPDSEHIMGWDISEGGFRIVLSPELPELIRNNLAGDLDAFLAKHRLTRGDIGSWVIHTGGPKILETMQETLGLGASDLERSWDCLKNFGNLSSASVLLVLEDVITNHRPEPGTMGVLLAMGPGFCAELILLRW